MLSSLSSFSFSFFSASAAGAAPPAGAATATPPPPPIKAPPLAQPIITYTQQILLRFHIEQTKYIAKGSSQNLYKKKPK
ncbi:hypothetical protein CJ030_MR5G018715 [Morella rubra]|uniref:Secreted protein n=1 Tax=Morella rubra TaxID=262757 RepID=A0A6A1VJG5_9ROSI|nr:hypothetical protein CJ030_MR5G018715 [Morella rubra]